MENGQVKGGDGPQDTFIKMLEQNVRITAPIAHGIAAEYPTVQELIKGFKKHGPHALKNCLKSANRDGAFTDRSVGPKISERLYAIFTDRDPNSWDV
jgi:crossover junction endonuclease EME1